ncbi:MAG: hypothetical protein EPN94_11035 [Nitrospirae bacterium]|nr:MAG: hypothetical protein EPN94_11035 [Nitrospirota bacterium]
MVSSEIEICNQAALLLADNTISDFSENSVTAKLANAFYKQSRDAVLRLHTWNFAIMRVKLAPDAAAPAFGYSAAFTLPVDCLRILDVGISAYKVERRKILCDSTSINLKYVFKNEDVTEYDSLFVDTLAAYIAFKMSYPRTRSNEVKKTMFDTFKSLLPLARNIDGQEEPQDTIGDFPFIDVRSR